MSTSCKSYLNLYQTRLTSPITTYASPPVVDHQANAGVLLEFLKLLAGYEVRELERVIQERREAEWFGWLH